MNTNTTVGVSVVIPCYQHQTLVDRAVRSCLAQTFADIEIMVVDDGSEPAIDDVWSASDSRVRVIRTKNQGLAAARNEGLAMARGEYIKFLDADDELLPDCLALQVASLRGARQTVSVIAYELDDSEQRVPVYPKFDDFFSSLFLFNIAPPHAWLYRTAELRDQQGYYAGPRTQGGNEDYDLYLRLALADFDAVTVHRLGVRYHQTPGSMSRKRMAMERSLAAVSLSAAQMVLEESGRLSTRQLFAVFAGLATKAEQVTDHTPLADMALRVLDVLAQRHDINTLADDVGRWASRIDLLGDAPPWPRLVNALRSITDTQKPVLLSRHELVSLHYPLAYRSQAQDLALQMVKDLSARFSQSDRIVLWGGGYWGRYWLRFLQALGMNVVAVIDAQARADDCLEGVAISKPEHLEEVVFNKLVICSVAFFDDIRASIGERQRMGDIVDLRQWMKV